MAKIVKVDLTKLKDYSDHLKRLSSDDRVNRFGCNTADYAIDQLMLRMAYNPKIHRLWQAIDSSSGEVMGWGHMVNDHDNVWELALSVERSHQRKGVGDALITEMLSWAKFRHIDEVFMHCIDNNKVIQHLALKHDLKTKERSAGEQTASIELPPASFFENNAQWFKEYSKLADEMAELRLRMINLALGITHHTQ